MTVKEEIDKFTHEVEEVLHEMEGVFHDVKEHMILSVRDYSLQIAFVLMGITSAILVIGTVYVWCFHHPKHSHAQDPSRSDKSQSELPVKPEQEHSGATDIVKSEIAQNADEERREDTPKESNDKVETTEDIAANKPEQNGQVRKRTTSSSINNNNSPVKSKIPVYRQKSKTS